MRTKRNKPLVERQNERGSKQFTNYFRPLQTLDDDNDDKPIETDTLDEIIIKPPPITLIKQNTKFVHELMAKIKTDDYFIKTISIGIKIFLPNMDCFNAACNQLKEHNCEFYTYDTRSNKPYKAILSGLDKLPIETVKSMLQNLGLQCTEVKIVEKKTKSDHELLLYIVYFVNKSITVKELRKNFMYVNHTKVRWEYKVKLQNKITQCYNCQLFGHGSNNCSVKTSCAHCAGSHQTAVCMDVNNKKCANCKGDHPSTELTCPCRISYLNLLSKRSSQRIGRNNLEAHGMRNSKQHIAPSALFGNQPQISLPTQTKRVQQLNFGSYSNALTNIHTLPNPKANITNETNLFSYEEINSLLSELITRLNECSNKGEQFQVISQLAIKYVYTNK